MANKENTLSQLVDPVKKLADNYDPKGDEKKARDWVYRRKYAMEDNPKRKEAAANWDKWMANWEMIRSPQGNDEWQSNHVVPITTAVVETVLAEVIDQSPRPLILPRGTEDAPKAMVMSHAFDYTWDIADGDLELYNVLKDAFILGTGIAQEYYWKEARKVTNAKGEEEMVYDYDDCYMESVRLWDFYVDETARGFTGPYQARDCIRRYIMDIDDFRTIFLDSPIWDNLKNAKYVMPGGDTSYLEWFKPPNKWNAERDVEVLWYWSRKPLDALYITANGVLVFKGPNPYNHKQLPFARAVDIKRTHDFYGKGEPELLESIQDEGNTLRRMILDRNHLDIDKMFFVSPHLNISDEDLIARPHGAIPSDDMNSAKAIEYGDIPRSVELSLNNLGDDAVIVTGINPRAESLPSTGTATEAAIIKESTLKRIRLKMRIFEREFLTTIARLRVSNILQYYPQARLQKILGDANSAEYKKQLSDLQARGLYQSVGGEDFQKSFRQIRTKDVKLSTNAVGQPVAKSNTGYSFFDLKPEFLIPARGGYDIKFEAGSTIPVSKALLKQETSEMYDRVIQIASLPNSPYDIKKLTDDLIKANDKNPSDFYSETETDNNQRLNIAIDLANQENAQLIKGVVVPPTPFAPPAHTQIHVEFTASPQFQALKPDSPIIQNMVNHITGEYTAQESRGAGAPGTPGETPPGPSGPTPPTAPGGTPAAIGMSGMVPQPGAVGGANRNMQAVMPGKMQGGGQVKGVAS